VSIAIPQIETTTTTQTITTATTTTTTPPVSNSTTCKLISCTPIADHDYSKIVKCRLVLRKGTTPLTPSNTSQMHDLYDDRLAKLQHFINHELSLLASTKTKTSQQIESVYYYHEWILAHQLYSIVQFLEASAIMMVSAPLGTDAMAGRQYRGRNRQPI
jgi:hypothetical protein